MFKNILVWNGNDDDDESDELYEDFPELDEYLDDITSENDED